MITELEEQYNHTTAQQSTTTDDNRRTASPPAPLEDGLPARTEGGFTSDDIQELKRVEHSDEEYSLIKSKLAIHEAKEASRRADYLEEMERLKDFEELAAKAELNWVVDRSEVTLTPLLLTRGVQSTKPTTLQPQKTVIDWLTFTANEPVEILEQFVSIVIPGCIFIDEDIGTQGYKKIISITLKGETLGRIGYMGTSPKNMLCLTGNGTEKIQDWELYTYWLSLLNEYSISQIHLALDDYEGKVLSHDIVMKAYADNKFKSNKSRVNPSIQEIGFTTGNGINKGRTRNIGKTKGCVQSYTGYEKGLEQFFQLFGKLPEDQQEYLIPNLTLSDLKVEAEGINLDTSIFKYYRGEVKFHNNGVTLPIDIILDRDKYYSGSYPFCAEVLPMIETKRPLRLPSTLEIELEEMFLNLGNSYGSSIFTALSIYKGQKRNLNKECVNIVKKIMQNHMKLNQKMVKAGGLDHIQPFDIKELDKKTS